MHAPRGLHNEDGPSRVDEIKPAQIEDDLLDRVGFKPSKLRVERCGVGHVQLPEDPNEARVDLLVDTDRERAVLDHALLLREQVARSRCNLA